MNEKLKELGAISNNEIKFSKELNFKKIEKKLNFKFPKEYKNMIKEFNGNSIGFKQGIQYIPKVAPPIVTKKGYLGLDFFYGINEGNLNIFSENKSYIDILPSNLITIGLVLSGDEICFDRVTKNIIYWWHEASSFNEQVFLISNTFSDFLNILEANEEKISNNIILESSYLDF